MPAIGLPEVAMSDKSLRVLFLANQDDDARRVIRAIAQAPTRFDVEHVSSLAAARGRLGLAPFDAILVDLSLSDAPGVGTVGLIRQQTPQIPLVAITRHTEDMAGALSDQGADDCLATDGITPELLDRSIRYAIERGRGLKMHGLLDKLRVSEQLLEKKNQRLAKLYEFAHHSVDDISHEFRTPLTVITEYVSLLRDGIVGEVSQEQTRMLNIVADRADDLNTMVDDMLDVSKLKTGTLGLYRESLPGGDDHRAHARQFGAQSRPARAQLTVEIEEGLAAIYCDAEKVGRVIINLTVNAIKSCGDPGAVRLWARNHASRSQVMIGVTGNGPGIDSAGLARIFKRFNHSEVQPRGGKSIGLGLSIARQLVELNLGQLMVESQPESGNTFYFSMPTAELRSVVPRYLKQFRGHKKGPRDVTLISAAIDPTTGDKLADEMNAFLNCALRQNDLVFRDAPKHWLIILPVGREEAEHFIARMTRLRQQTNRNRPHGPLPKAGLHIEGTWAVADNAREVISYLQALVGPQHHLDDSTEQNAVDELACELAGGQGDNDARRIPELHFS